MSQSSRLAYRIYARLWGSLDLIYPPTCGGCEAAGSRWCQNCQANITWIESPACERCGQSLDRPGICSTCRHHPPHFELLRSAAVFTGPIRQTLHKLKYRRDMSLGVVLAGILIPYLENLNWQLDWVIPVPLGIARYKERGYNQVELIAKPLAMGVGIPYRSHGLIRVRETRSQVGLSIEQRRENVRGAFEAASGWAYEQRLLIVDDVATSSATMDACASALLQAGASTVFGLTLARAAYAHGSSLA